MIYFALGRRTVQPYIGKLVVMAIENFSEDCLGSRRGIRPRPVRSPHLISVFPTRDEQDAAFLVSVIDCFECDSFGLNSLNSSCSIARLKESLRRKKMRPGKREESEPDFLDSHRLLYLACNTTACWPLDLESCTSFTSLALQPLAFDGE